MKKVILCGHTGSINRGCEAIVRSTTSILKECGVNDIAVTLYNLNTEQKIINDENIEPIVHPKNNFFQRAFKYVKRKLVGSSSKDFEYLYKKAVKKAVKEDAILFNIGGDTYCYGTPNISYALNNLARRNGINNVFWGCSVDGTLLSNLTMIEDVNKYSAILVREKISQSIFEKCITDQNKVYKVCDPAFHLKIEETKLPKGFQKGNTLGINISPLVFKDKNNENDIMYQNIYSLIDYTLNETDMSVCLIPHVYNVKDNLQDIEVLRNIYSKYKDNARVSLIEEELSCTQIKYIISNCRFFIGSRTHATIAAYSTGVPCIAISYSVKSRGIAIDLFGKEEGYAMPYHRIEKEDELLNNFKMILVENEENLRKNYESVLPSYKQSIIDVTKDLLNRL